MDAASRPGAARWRDALREAPVTWAVGALNVGWFLWMAAHGSTTDPDVLVRFGALEPARVRAGEWWRLVTAAFVHVGALHLGMNTLFGAAWCRQLERALRPRRFALLYLASAVAGTAASLAGQGVLSAGASGAIFGVIGATLALHRRALGSWRAFAASPGVRAVAANLAVLAVAGLWLPLDQWAHGAGLTAGAALAWSFTLPPRQRPAAWAVLGAALAAVVVAAVRPGRPPSLHERVQVEARLEESQEALDARDVAAARRAVDAARALGIPGLRLEFQEAAVLLREGDLEGALERFRSLEGEPGELGANARVNRGRVALALGEAHARGVGRLEDPVAALRYYEDACEAGLPTGCELAVRARAPRGR